jgi:hypothetical protein
MGPPSSIRITRVPTYSSLPTLSPFRLQGFHLLSLAFPNHSTTTIKLYVTGLLRVRSPLLTESLIDFFSYGYLDVSVPHVRFINLCIQFMMTPKSRVPPFRYLRINACLPTPRSFSQATTSFIAFYCQGIHRVHLLSWLYKP